MAFVSVAHAEDSSIDEAAEADEGDEPDEPDVLPALPPPTLEDPEPVAPAAPGPEPDESRPQILTHIGAGDHPEWETDPDEPGLPPDIAFEVVPVTDHRLTTNRVGAEVSGVDLEEPMPPFLVTAGVGFARLLAVVPFDFLRIEERFEARIPDFEALRVGASATQMIGDNGYIGGGGARIGMGVSLCERGTSLMCEGVVFVQPGILTGLIGTRFDLNASISVRLIIERLLQLVIDGGYSLDLDGNGSIMHITGQAGFVF